MHGKLVAAVAGLATIFALITGETILLRLSYMLWALLALAFLMTYTSVRWLDIGRHTRARRGEVGSHVEELFRVHNRSWLPKLWLELRDDSDLPGHRASRVLSTLGPGKTRTWTVRTRCQRRGHFTLGPITLVGGDPLGLFEARRPLGQTAPFIVYPRSVPLRGVDLPTGYLSGGQVIRRRAEFATTNVRGVRPYLPGDAMNRVHWPTTARRGALYTKEFELDPIADFWILLDLQRDVQAGPEAPTGPGDEEAGALPWLSEPEDGDAIHPNTEEYAVTAAASLGRHFLDAGKSVGLIAYGQRRVLVRPDRGERQVHKLLASLAVIRAVGRESLSDVLSTESHELTRNTTLVVITSTTALRWIEGLRELRLRGVRSLVVLVEANSFGAAAAPDAARTALAAHNIPTRSLRRGDDLAAALGQSGLRLGA